VVPFRAWARHSAQSAAIDRRRRRRRRFYYTTLVCAISSPSCVPLRCSNAHPVRVTYAPQMRLPPSAWLKPRHLQYAPDVHPPPRCEICRRDTMVTSVRSWCYACQVLVLQRHDGSGVGDDDRVHEPRFPYKPWKQRLPRSYNKVGDTAYGIFGI